jgi:hypothetical protein
MSPVEAAPGPVIESRIYLIRGQKVLLDRDLARLYQVKPIALRQQIRRNPKRFPSDFMFELDEEEVEALLSQNVIASRRSLGGSRPLAFTEQDIAIMRQQIQTVFETIQHLIEAPDEEPKRRIGFPTGRTSHEHKL